MWDLVETPEDRLSHDATHFQQVDMEPDPEPEFNARDEVSGCITLLHFIHQKSL